MKIKLLESARPDDVDKLERKIRHLNIANRYFTREGNLMVSLMVGMPRLHMARANHLLCDDVIVDDKVWRES